MHRMATQKRRIVYLSDEEWRTLTEQAETNGTTISAYIRSALGFSTLPFRTAREIGLGQPRPRISAQAERDAILRKINKGG